jgi:alkanesulfonate monooxygenase SsuD/methylene tetrahydromethanopterin reductase-like flavin-dependent oxidoreductase (luciferase family)
MFQTPLQPPEKTPRQVFDWAVDQAIAADKAGFTEYWVGEHATLNWESIPNPELVIAASVRETEKIKFGPGAHLPPYYHPASLAVQVAWLSRVLEGRYMLGVGAGAYPSDAALRGMTDVSKNHEMLFEALDIMQMIWSADEPFHYEGNFWNAGYPEVEEGHEWRDLSPYNGKIEIGMTALSERSPSIRMAGERGFIPMSVFAGNEFLRNHWRDYEAAASAAGHTPDRSVHHVLRDAVVAETDAEAKKLAIEGGLGRAWREYLLPTYKRFGILKSLLHDPSMDMDDVDLEYLAEHVWITGSVDTVVDKMNTWQEEVGGFGTLLIYSHDYSANPEPWVQSMNLLAQEVAPRVKSPASAVTA